MSRLKSALVTCVLVACAMHGSASAIPGSALLNRTAWYWSSTPIEDTWDLVPPPNLVAEHLRLEWYNPRNVKERDLNPALSDAEGGDSERKVLELNLKPPTTAIDILPSSWTGITQVLSPVGQDYTRFQFLDLWVNDFTPYPLHVNVRAKLHMDLGRVSEDAFWKPDSTPNDRLDSEDKNGDGTLDRSDDLLIDEDTGLDGIHSVNEPGYSGAGSDPHGDDYHFDPNQVPLDYSRINNTEGNGIGIQGVPDTEDLNRDGFADFGPEAYYQATIDLADTSRIVATDVTRDYGPIEETLEHPLSPINGWRRYRLPLSEEAFQKVGFASWENVQHIRLWLNGAESPMKVQIGGIEFLDSLGRAMPRKPVVYQNAPNPFNPGTTIRFDMPADGSVRLRIYDAHGRLVRSLVHDQRPAGYYAVFWNGEDDSGRRVASGVYWYRAELPGISPQTRKMVLAR